jgi:hypothetical protein
MAREAKLGFFALPLFKQLGLRIGPGLMGVIAALLARKIAPAIAIFWAAVAFVLGPEAFQGGPGVDQGPIDGKNVPHLTGPAP